MSFQFISIIAEQSTEQLLACAQLHSLLWIRWIHGIIPSLSLPMVTESEALNLQRLGSEVPVSQLVLQLFWIDITLQNIEETMLFEQYGKKG